MNKKFFLKLVAYILSIFLLIITIINHIYRLKEKNFPLYPSFVALACISYYFFMDNITKDNTEFDNSKRFIMISFLLYSSFELLILILNWWIQKSKKGLSQCKVVQCQWEFEKECYAFKRWFLHCSGVIFFLSI